METFFEYEEVHGRLWKRIDHEGNYISYGYDPQGNIIEKSYHTLSGELSNRKRFLYQHPSHNMPGKLFREINPDDTYTEYGYDPEGNVVSMTDPNGSTTLYDYGRLKQAHHGHAAGRYGHFLFI